MYRIKLTLIIVMMSSITAFAQYQVDISTSYSMPTSTNFSDKFNNGFGFTGELLYFFKDSRFSASFLIGMNSFRANEQFELDLENSNPTIFDYDYQIHYNVFPVLLGANYTFFKAEKLNLRLGVGAGMQFMEMKKKLIGEYVSDTYKDHFNEFSVNPVIGVSYEVSEGIDIVFKSRYNVSLGEIGVSYLDLKLGLKYDL